MSAAAAFALTADSRRLIAPLVLLSTADATGNQVWINIANAGEWNGHPAGPFKFDAGVFDRIIENAAGRATPINCDYEHQTFRKGSSGPIPSSGKILKLERRGDSELWALVELTSRAAQMVRDGEIRSCSPVIEFDSKDRVSGKDIGPEMLSLALTNDPFQDGLQPIRLSRSADMADNADDKKPADEKKKDDATCMSDPAATQLAADGGDAGADTADAGGGDAVDANSVFNALADAAGAGKAAVLAAIADNIDKFVNVIQETLAKGDGNASEGKAMSRITAVAGDLRTLRTELRVKDKTVVQLTARLEKLEAKAKADNDAHVAKEAERVKAHVLSLQKSGHVGPTDDDQKDAIELFTSNWDRAARTYSRQFVPVGAPDTDDETNDGARANPPTGPVTLSNLDEKTKARVEFMMRAGIAQDDALKTVTAQTAGKGN